MSFYLKPESVGQNSTSAISPGTPKTHTPGSRLQGLGARFYKPEVGRWLNRDPIGEGGGRNLYRAAVGPNTRDARGLVEWGVIAPWEDKALDAVNVTVLPDGNYGTTTFDYDVKFDCDEACGVVRFKIWIVEYEYAAQTGDYAERVKAAEEQHYNSIKQLYDNSVGDAKTHDGPYPSTEYCTKGAEMYNKRWAARLEKTKDENKSLDAGPNGAHFLLSVEMHNAGL